MDWTGSCVTVAYAKKSRGLCDLDLNTIDMVLADDTSSCHDNHLSQIILKSNQAGKVMDWTRACVTIAYAQS